MDILDIMMAKKLSGGGGSGDSKAVKYTQQTLTEQQQMQARANLGLYGTITSGDITWDGTGEVDPALEPFKKINDTPLLIDDMVGRTIVVKDSNGEVMLESVIENSDITYNDPMIIVGRGYPFVLSMLSDYDTGGMHIPKGLYFTKNEVESNYYMYTASLSGGVVTTKIEKEYLPDDLTTSLYVNAGMVGYTLDQMLDLMDKVNSGKVIMRGRQWGKINAIEVDGDETSFENTDFYAVVSDTRKIVFGKEGNYYIPDVTYTEFIYDSLGSSRIELYGEDTRIIDMENGCTVSLPPINDSDNGKILKVVNGEWDAIDGNYATQDYVNQQISGAIGGEY